MLVRERADDRLLCGLPGLRHELERLQHRRRDVLRAGDARQLDEADALAARVLRGVRRPKGKGGLADAARAEQRERAHVAAKDRRDDLFDVSVAAARRGDISEKAL